MLTNTVFDKTDEELKIEALEKYIKSKENMWEKYCPLMKRKCFIGRCALSVDNSFVSLRNGEVVPDSITCALLRR